MQKITTTLFLIAFALVAHGQTNVYLKINHKLNGNTFSYNQTATTSGLAQYQVSRLEYYIGEIKINHGRGQVTTVPNKWILVDAGTTTNELLGNFNVSNIQSISFGIGVDSSANHTDPSLRASGHPLAHRFPSMHWGWSAGYRFVAFEGNTGTNFGQIFQIHALGDRNYRTQTQNVTAYMQNGNLIIELDADYNQALNSITVNSNLLYHGELAEAATLLSNFQSSVFTQTAVGLNELGNDLVKLSVSPNPSNGEIHISINDSFSNLSYKVLDMTGREIQNGVIENLSHHTLTIQEKGIFMVNFFENGVRIARERVIIQ